MRLLWQDVPGLDPDGFLQSFLDHIAEGSAIVCPNNERQLLLREEAEDQALDSLEVPAIVQILRKALFAAEVNCKQHQPLVPVPRCAA